MNLTAGAKLGRYEIRSKIGEGGMGEVFILKELQEKHTRNEGPAFDVAAIYAGLGDKDQAFVWLEKGFTDRSGRLGRTNWEVGFESLRGDPRFADLIRRMGIKI